MRLIAVEAHVLPHEVRDAWAAAPPPHDSVSAFADNGDPLTAPAAWAIRSGVFGW